MEVTGIDTSLRRFHYAFHAAMFLASRFGHIRTSEAISRTFSMRHARARLLARRMKHLGLSSILHTGTLDMPAPAEEEGVSHYLYCDHTWGSATRFQPDIGNYSYKAIREFERVEAESYAKCAHIFTFGDYVRDDLMRIYGVPGHRVTAVGSGMGNIEPYLGPKDYSNGRLLFIAKHLFYQKGGYLLLDAFRIAQRERPDLSLVIVGNAPADVAGIDCPNVEIKPFVPWDELQSLLRRASLLVQPMLNDPWGQVYLEALISRTPVIGLNRNGLPEITAAGKFGFLVDSATPEAVADTVLRAASEPERLVEMGRLGQQHVMQTYSWETVGAKIAQVIKARQLSSSANRDSISPPAIPIEAVGPA